MGLTPASAKRLITPWESLSRALHPILIHTKTTPAKNTTMRVMIVTAMMIRWIPPALSSAAARDVFMPSCKELRTAFSKKIILRFTLYLHGIYVAIHQPPMRTWHILGHHWVSSLIWARPRSSRRSPWPCRTVQLTTNFILHTQYSLFLQMVSV